MNPYKAQLGSNLAPTWPPKSLQNRSQDDVKTQLPENLIFATPPTRNARFCFPKGLPKRSKMHSKTTWNTLAFSTSKKHPPSFDFAPTWLPLGPPKAPPRGLQGLLKITLGSILGHLSCKFQFLASQGVPPGPIFSIFDQFLMVFKAGFVLNVVSTPFTNGAFVGPIAFATTLDFQLLNVTIGFHGLSFRACFCISYLQNRPLPRRSGRSPRESAAA